MQKTAQATQALGFVGQIVAIDGQTSKLDNDQAGWSFNSAKPAAATINIKNSAGATVYTGTFSLNAGTQNFVWDGRNNNGVKQPDGDYTMVDHRQGREPARPSRSRPKSRAWSIRSTCRRPRRCFRSAAPNYTLDKIKRVVRYVPPTTRITGSASSAPTGCAAVQHSRALRHG